jgi:hypothetical protein
MVRPQMRTSPGVDELARDAHAASRLAQGAGRVAVLTFSFVRAARESSGPELEISCAQNGRISEKRLQISWCVCYRIPQSRSSTWT